MVNIKMGQVFLRKTKLVKGSQSQMIPKQTLDKTSYFDSIDDLNICACLMHLQEINEELCNHQWNLDTKFMGVKLNFFKYKLFFLIK